MSNTNFYKLIKTKVLHKHQISILYLSCFTVNSCNIPMILWQPIVDISAKWPNKFHFWRVVVIKGVIGNPLLEFCHVIWTLWTPAQQNSVQWKYFTLQVILLIRIHLQLSSINLTSINQSYIHIQVHFT